MLSALFFVFLEDFLGVSDTEPDEEFVALLKKDKNTFKMYILYQKIIKKGEKWFKNQNLYILN